MTTGYKHLYLYDFNHIAIVNKYDTHKIAINQHKSQPR